MPASRSSPFWSCCRSSPGGCHDALRSETNGARRPHGTRGAELPGVAEFAGTVAARGEIPAPPADRIDLDHRQGSAEEVGMKKLCAAPGCERLTHAHGYCGMHYMRVKVHGNTETLLRRKKGAGYISSGGYHLKCVNGVTKQEHVRIAEAALGHTLPPRALVHHVDRNRINNSADNLVICPNDAYHALLHQRTRAFEECGHASWLKCQHCQRYDDPKNLNAGGAHWACVAEYELARRITKGISGAGSRGPRGPYRKRNAKNEAA